MNSNQTQQRRTRIQVTLPRELRQQLAYLVRDRRSLTGDEVRNAIRFYLRHLGYLPPGNPRAEP